MEKPCAITTHGRRPPAGSWVAGYHQAAQAASPEMKETSRRPVPAPLLAIAATSPSAPVGRRSVRTLAAPRRRGEAPHASSRDAGRSRVIRIAARVASIVGVSRAA
ncbi:hypothetical protein GCM10022215_00270 [Nocardioides fonticola]|uniref:Uncharacterized protein n=1 Tax=Nocardioides fonticola TaxID=450363 RepID=A0ABP7X8X4_9ACTN